MAHRTWHWEARSTQRHVSPSINKVYGTKGRLCVSLKLMLRSRSHSRSLSLFLSCSHSLFLYLLVHLYLSMSFSLSLSLSLILHLSLSVVYEIYDVYLNSTGPVQALQGDRLVLNCTATAPHNSRVNIRWSYPGEVSPSVCYSQPRVLHLRMLALSLCMLAFHLWMWLS